MSLPNVEMRNAVSELEYLASQGKWNPYLAIQLFYMCENLPEGNPAKKADHERVPLLAAWSGAVKRKNPVAAEIRNHYHERFYALRKKG